MGRRARKRIEEEFSASRMVRRCQIEYERLMLDGMSPEMEGVGESSL